MIITCEKCNARYLLASLLLGAVGRTVRCGVCGHQWFQEQIDEMPGDDDEDDDSAGVIFDDDDDEKPDFRKLLDDDIPVSIPAGVQPIPEGSSVPALNSHKDRKNFDAPTRNGLVGVALIILMIVATLAVMRERVVQLWQPASLMYSMAGMQVSVPGDGLIFDRVSAKATADEAGVYHLKVKGNVINLHAKDAALPKIRVTLRRSETDPADSWVIVTENNTIGPEEVFPFETQFDNLPGEMKEVNLRFIAD